MAKKRNRSRQVVRNIPPSPEPLEVIETEVSVSQGKVIETSNTGTGLDARLKSMRHQVLQAKADTSHTITELEQWRDEISDTIAFLRANR